MSEFNQFVDDWSLFGLYGATRRAIIRFRWKHDIRRQKEIWLDDLPIELEREVHSSKIEVGRIKCLCDVLGIGDWADFVDDDDWFESIKVIGQSGFSNDDLELISSHPVFSGSTTKCFLFPSKILEDIRYTENGCIEYKTTDRRNVPATVKIHYGRGEVPYWMTEEWLRSRTDPEYMQYGQFNSDPFSPCHKPLIFS